MESKSTNSLRQYRPTNKCCLTGHVRHSGTKHTFPFSSAIIRQFASNPDDPINPILPKHPRQWSISTRQYRGNFVHQGGHGNSRIEGSHVPASRKCASRIHRGCKSIDAEDRPEMKGGISGDSHTRALAHERRQTVMVVPGAGSRGRGSRGSVLPEVVGRVGPAVWYMRRVVAASAIARGLAFVSTFEGGTGVVLPLPLPLRPATTERTRTGRARSCTRQTVRRNSVYRTSGHRARTVFIPVDTHPT